MTLTATVNNLAAFAHHIVDRANWLQDLVDTEITARWPNQQAQRVVVTFNQPDGLRQGAIVVTLMNSRSNVSMDIEPEAFFIRYFDAHAGAWRQQRFAVRHDDQALDAFTSRLDELITGRTPAS